MAYGDAPTGYTLPKRAEEFAEHAHATVSLWDPRQIRFGEDVRTFAGQPRTIRLAPELDDDEVVTSNEGRAQIQQAAAYLHEADPDLHVALAQERGEQEAQALEDWARDKRRLWSQQHGRGIRMPLITEEALHLFTLGWLTTRTLWNPDPRAARYPFRITLLNPAQVFPCLTDEGVDYVLHCTEQTVGEIAQDWPRKWWDTAAKDYLGDLEDKDRVKITAVYTDTEMAAMVGDSGWLKKPVKHGYGLNPIQVQIAHGAPWRKALDSYNDSSTLVPGARTPVVAPQSGVWGASGLTGTEWPRYYGVGILDAIRQNIRDKEEALSMLKLIVAKMAVPGFWSTSADPSAMEDPPRGVGDVLHLRLGETLSPVFPPASALAGAQSLLGGLQRYIDTGALGGAAFGGGDPASGFDRFQDVAAALKILKLYVSGYAAYLEEFYMRLFRLFSALGQAPSPFQTMDPTGRRVFGPPLDPQSAVGADEGVEVMFRSFQTQDLMARVNAGTMLKRDGIASAYYIRTELLGIANPIAEDARIRKERVLEDPLFTRLLGLQEVMQDAQQNGDQAVLAVAGNLYQQMLAQATVPSPAPGMTGGNQPPPAGTGVPSQVMPDEMAQNAGLPPNGVALGPEQEGAALQGLV